MTTLTTGQSGVTDGRLARRHAVLATARVEAGRMTRHPAFLVGLAGALSQVMLRPGAEDWAGQSHYLSSVAWTFVWVGTLVSAALAAGRERFVDDAEVFPATPATPGDRVLGTALGLVGPALATGVGVAVAATGNVLAGGFDLGDEGYNRSVTLSVLDWVQPVALVVLAGAVGIALAQLRRGRLPALIAAVLAVFLGGTMIWAFQVHPVRVLHPFMFPAYEQQLPDSFDPAGWRPGDAPLNPPDDYNAHWRAVRFDDAALGWHLLYVAGLVLVVVWVAAWMADRGEDRPRSLWLVRAGLPLLLLGGVAQIVTAGVNG